MIVYLDEENTCGYCAKTLKLANKAVRNWLSRYGFAGVPRNIIAYQLGEIYEAMTQRALKQAEIQLKSL